MRKVIHDFLRREVSRIHTAGAGQRFYAVACWC